MPRLGGALGEIQKVRTGPAVVARMQGAADESGEKFSANPGTRCLVEGLLKRSLGESDLATLEVFQCGLVGRGPDGFDRDDPLDGNSPWGGPSPSLDHQDECVVFGDLAHVGELSTSIGLADHHAITTLRGQSSRYERDGHEDEGPHGDPGPAVSRSFSEGVGEKRRS